MANIQFFIANDAERLELSLRPNFSLIDPIAYSCKNAGKEIPEHIIPITGRNEKCRRFYDVTLPDGTHVEIDVTLYWRDENVEYTFLERGLQKLIDEGKIPADAWFQVY